MIRPVEMQMLVQRTDSVSHVQQQDNQRASQENFQFSNQMEKEIKHQQESVIKKNDSELAEYRYDAKEKGNGNYKGKDKKNKKKKQDADNKENRQVRSFDVKI